MLRPTSGTTQPFHSDLSARKRTDLADGQFGFAVIQFWSRTSYPLLMNRVKICCKALVCKLAVDKLFQMNSRWYLIVSCECFSCRPILVGFLYPSPFGDWCPLTTVTTISTTIHADTIVSVSPSQSLYPSRQYWYTPYMFVAAPRIHRLNRSELLTTFFPFCHCRRRALIIQGCHTAQAYFLS